MIDKILDESEEAKKFKILSKFNDFWSTFEQAVDECTQKYQTEVKIVHKEKQRHITYCDSTLRKAELEAERKSI